MALSRYPEKFLQFNTFQNKNLVISIEIPGIDILSSSALYTTLRYGDPVVYGDPIYYGGLRRVLGVRPLLSLEGSSLTLSQKIEPEQGRGSISMLTLSFIDQDGYMTKVISPGVLIDDILGKPVKVRIGFLEVSYPDQYFTVFRGRVSGVIAETGRVLFQISDPNIVRRQNIFYQPKTKTTTSLTNVQTNVPVVSNTDFFRQILGANGLYDSSVKTYIKVDDEWMEYGPTGIGTNTFTVTRGSRGTIAIAHNNNAEVTQGMELAGHGVDLALKIMLSGWNGVYQSAIPISSFVFTGDVTLGDQPNCIIIPPTKNAKEDYGITVGTYITISGSAIGANNNTFFVERFGDLLGEPNRLVYVNGPLTSEHPSSATLSLRSQYDTLPIACGSRMTPDDVDVDGHENFKLVWLNNAENSFRFFITNSISCKTFLESEIYLPMTAYSLTRLGRCSMGVTRPPIADQTLIFLNKDNVLDPVNVKPVRSTTNRKFFNEIDFQYDADDSDVFGSVLRTLNTDSLSRIGILSVLPIPSLGGRTDLGFDVVAKRRTNFLLSRYAFGAVLLNMKVNFTAGVQLEAGDIVAVQDNGDLQITNFATGERFIGVQLFEIIDRSFDLKDGAIQLQLLGGVSAQAADKFATWAPSSIIQSGSAPAQLVIADSYGALVGSEPTKWKDYIGLRIMVRAYDWSVSYETTLISLNVVNPYILNVSPIPVTPTAGWVIEPSPYPDNTDPLDQQLFKVVHGFWNRQAPVVTGISQTQFIVSTPDAAIFKVGNPIYIHNSDYSQTSFAIEALITDVTGVTITVNKQLGFTPNNTHFVELVGFKDKGPPYRYV